MSEQIDDGDLTQSLTARFGNRGADLADGEANWLVPQAGAYDVTSAGAATDGTVAPSLRSGGERSGRDSSGFDGDTPPVVTDPTLGQQVAGSLGGVGGTGGHRLDLDSSGAYVAGPGTDVAHTLTSEGFDATEDGTGRGTPIVPVPDPAGGQELAATLKGQRGKGGGGIGPEETLLPVDEATPPAVFSKRHAASDPGDSETWGESEQAHTLNQNMNAPDVAADAQAVRRLTPTEAERLQGVPDGWTLMFPTRRPDGEELLVLRATFGTENLSERANGTPVIVASEILRHALQGGGAAEQGVHGGGREGAGQEAGAEVDTRRALRIVWDYGRAPVPTSQGWRPAEQRPCERLDFVSWLSHLRGVGERHLREQAEAGNQGARLQGAHRFEVGLEDRGPSLADAPAWHDLRTPPIPVRAVTINEGNDTPTGSVWESEQVGSLTSGGGKPGQGYHAVRTEPTDPTWIGLDNANRGNDHVKEGEPNAEALRAKGTLDQAVCFHSDALGRDGEAKKDSPDAEGRMRKRDAGTGITEGESYNLTTGAPHAVGFYPNQGKDSHAPGAREGESPTLSGGGGGNTPAVAYDAVSSPPLTAAGFHGNADGSDDQVEATALAFESRYYSDRDRMGGAPSAESGPVKATDSKAGDAAQVVAFAAGSAVAAGAACPYDSPPDGPRYAALGDAVTAPVARWIGERLIDVMRERGVLAPDGAVDLEADLR